MRCLLVTLILLAVLAGSMIPSVDAKGVEVTLRTDWQSSILAELMEAIRAESLPMFLYLLEEGSEIIGDAKTDQQKAERYIAALTGKLSPTAIQLIKAQTAARTYAPVVETMQQQLDYRAAKGDCRDPSQVAVAILSVWYCFTSLAELKPVTPEHIKQSTGAAEPDVFDFDFVHHKGPYDTGIQVVVLYGTVGTKLTEECNKWLQSQWQISYIFRHKIAMSDPSPVLAAYGAVLDIKNVEYKAVNEDDKAQASTSGEGENADEIKGFKLSRLGDRYGDDLSTLSKFMEEISNEDAEAELKVWELKDLGYQTVHSIMKGEDPLKELTATTERFPLRVSKISKIPASDIEETTAALKRVQMNWGEGSSEFLFNGRSITPEKQDIYNLMDDAKKELDVFTQVGMALNFSGSVEGKFDIPTVRSFLNLPDFKKSKSSTNRVWIDADQVSWINDIEKDDMYQHSDPSLSTLLQPMMYGQPNLPRRNLLHMVYVIDPSKPEGRAVADTINRMYNNGIAVRFGILLAGRTHDWKAQAIMDCYYSVLEKPDGPDQAISLLRYLNTKELPDYGEYQKMRNDIRDICSEHFKVDLPEKQSEEFKEMHEKRLLYVQNELELDVERMPIAFFNGQMFGSDVIDSALYQGFNTEYGELRNWIQTDKLSDKEEDLYSAVMTNHGAVKRYNKALSAEPEFLTFKYAAHPSDPLPIGKNIVQNTPWIHSTEFDDEEPLFAHVLVVNSQAEHAGRSYQAAIDLLDHMINCGKTCGRSRVSVAMKMGTKKMMKYTWRVLTHASADMAMKKQALHVRKWFQNVKDVIDGPEGNRRGPASDRFGRDGDWMDKQILKHFRGDEELLNEFQYALPKKKKKKKKADAEAEEQEKKEDDDEVSDEAKDDAGDNKKKEKVESWTQEFGRFHYYYTEMLKPLQDNDMAIRGDYVITNGRAIAIDVPKHFDSNNENMTNLKSSMRAEDYPILEQQEEVRAKAVMEAVQKIDWLSKGIEGLDADGLNYDFFLEKTIRLHSIAAADMAIRGDKRSLYELPTPNPKHTISKEVDTALNNIHVMLDPLSRDAQKVVSLINAFIDLVDCNLIITLNPPTQVSSIPVKNFYTFVAPKWEWNADGAFETPKANFEGLPSKQLLTLGMVVPDAWVVMATDAVADLDNIKLSTLHADTLFAEYSLNSLTVTGSVEEKNTGSFPRGMPVVLRKHWPPLVYNRWMEEDIEYQNNAPRVDSLVMSNYGYFQMTAKPGVYHWAITGRGDEIYEVNSMQFDDQDPLWIGSWGRQAPKRVCHVSLKGIFIKSIVSKRRGKEGESLLSETKPDEDKGDEDKSDSAATSWPPTKGDRTEAPEKPTLNIFSVASGHLYERFLRMMMYTATQKSKDVHGTNTTRIKFWFIENFLSPQFKAFLPKLTQELGCEYQLVTYKWPHWLRKQSEKQRMIWAYKILFLDVLFPLDVEKIIFVDADQIIYTDLHELYNLDLHGKPVGYTPFCQDSVARPETKGFRFWDSGYWVDHLRGKFYHISAIYVVDLLKLRKMAGGDQYRMIYDSLSADPNSLSNLDQDLPNFAQHQIPIHSLPQEWLWCETWCTDESKKAAHTIDLCNNPLTKIPKLDNAKRIINNWEEMDAMLQKIEDEQ